MAGAMVWTIVADVVPVAERTSVFYQLTAVALMINVIVNPIAGWLLQFDPWIPMWLSFGFLVLGTLSTLLIPETLSLRRKADDRRRNGVNHETGHPEENENGNGTLKHRILQQAWFTIKNDMGHVWRFIFASKSVMILILALSAYSPIRLAFSNILLQYMTKRFNWEWSTVGTPAEVDCIPLLMASQGNLHFYRWYPCDRGLIARSSSSCINFRYETLPVRSSAKRSISRADLNFVHGIWTSAHDSRRGSMAVHHITCHHELRKWLQRIMPGVAECRR